MCSYRQTQRNFHLTRNQMSPRAMILLFFTVLTVISPTALGSLTITDRDYPLMYYTKLISEEYFTAGRPPRVDSSKKEVGYLIEELHESGRWPILVHNTDYKVNGIMYTEKHKHGSYIILTSIPCMLWESHITHFSQQLNELISSNNTKDSWNPRAKFVASEMSNCTMFDNKDISRTILERLCKFEVMKAAALFLKSNEQAGNDLQQNTNEPTQGTYVELHTWYPHENSDYAIQLTVL